MSCFKQTLAGKHCTITFEYSGSNDNGGTGFGFEDAFSGTFTYEAAARDNHWLRCPPADINADLDPGQILFLGNRHTCCPNLHQWYYKFMALADWVDCGTRTNIWEGPGDPPFPAPVYHFGAYFSIQSIAMKHCRAGGITDFMAPESEDNLVDTTPTASIVTQASADDPNVVAEFTITYDGTGSHFVGSSQFTWTDPQGRDGTIFITAAGGVGEWVPFSKVECVVIGEVAALACKVEDGFLFKVLAADCVGLDIVAPVFFSNDMKRAAYVRGANAAHAQVDIYKRNPVVDPETGLDTDVLGDPDTSFLWLQLTTGDLIAEASEDGFTISGGFSGTGTDGTVYSGSMSMVLG